MQDGWYVIQTSYPRGGPFATQKEARTHLPVPNTEPPHEVVQITATDDTHFILARPRVADSLRRVARTYREVDGTLKRHRWLLHDTVLDAKRQGMSLSEIAAVVGVSKARIQQIVQTADHHGVWREDELLK